MFPLSGQKATSVSCDVADYLCFVSHRLFYSCSYICTFRQADAYRKLFLELGIVIGTQILYVLQERLLVDRPDREKKQHRAGNK